MDKILISSIDCVAAIGVTAEERTIKQRLSIDVEILTDAAPAAHTDSLRTRWIIRKWRFSPWRSAGAGIST